MNSATHGNATPPHSPGDASPVAADDIASMEWTEPSAELPLPRHALISQQSSSLPSTPYQHPRSLPRRVGSPSSRRRSTSPCSVHSETNNLPSYRRPLTGCKYETGMAHFRRRMPYSLGGDILPEEKVGVKKHLDPNEEEKLTGDMRELYDRLLPSAESDDRRRQLVQKLEKLLNRQWPGNDIKVHVFGSSGNKLCFSDSDVDICITTPYKELEHVCSLADVLAKHGMERVVCVSHAKVPIVKIWDPDLRLACDMNVNNTLALENTRMIRTYVDIDERMRPLAMIIKYWTKRRVLNDAALGGTLSSYTWICLIINFLQTRNPPILPSLQARAYKQNLTGNGVHAAFDDNLEELVGFGKKNKQTLGELLFEFFRYYGHEVDYEKSVISVREGKLISKEGKGWHLLQNNRLCVEEPFNTSRNLGNTADDSSFRGVHLELRAAFKALSQSNLEKCCEQYEFPPEEERVWEKPPPGPRPILAPTPSHASSRGGRGGGRGARHSNQFGRGGNNARRSSANSGNRDQNHNRANQNFRSQTFGLPTDMSFQAQQAQYLLHDHLYQQIQILQAQEQELRMQLQNQSLLTGRPPPVLIRQPFIQFPFPHQEAPADENSRSRAGSVNQPPLTSPLRQPMFFNSQYFPMTTTGVQGSNTNPPSPSTTAAVPELRRSPRRSSVASGSPGGSLRSHSQPARSLHSPVMQNLASLYSSPQSTMQPQNFKDQGVSGSPARSSNDGEPSFSPNRSSTLPRSAATDDHRLAEYAGYYVDATHPLTSYHQNLMAMSLPTTSGMVVSGHGMLPYMQNSTDYRTPVMPFSEPFGTTSDQNSPHIPQQTPSQGASQNISPQRAEGRPAVSQSRGPLIIDGSVPPADRGSASVERNEHYATASQTTSTSDDLHLDTPASTSDFELNEPSSFDLDSSTQPSHAHEVHGPGDFNPSKIGRTGSLSARLQNIRLSNNDRSAEPSIQRQFENTSTEIAHDLSANKRSPDSRMKKTPERPIAVETSLPKNISPNTSPTARRRPNGAEFSKTNGVGNRGRQKMSPDAVNAQSPVLSNDSKERQIEASSRKPDSYVAHHGPRDLGISGINGGWQTTKKKHKRNAKSVIDTRHLKGVEPLPLDESMRKGG